MERTLTGYVRLATDDESVEVVELVREEAPQDGPALRAVADLTRRLDRPRIETWLAPGPATEGWFTDIGRETTQPMVRGTTAPADACFWGSDYF